MTQNRLVAGLKTYWAETLWGGVLMAFGLNLAYVLWPQVPQPVVIRPHPATLQVYLDPKEPILVEAGATQPQEKNYLLMSAPQSDVHRAQRISAQGRHGVSDKKPLPLGKININTAGLPQLQQLPGIGPAMAARIAAYRKAHGPFQSAQQLLDVPGIGPKKLEKLLPYCTF